jgi:hypothetical protein
MLCSNLPTDLSLFWESFQFNRSNPALYHKNSNIILIPTATCWAPNVEVETNLDLTSFLQNSLGKFYNLLSQRRVVCSTFNEPYYVEESTVKFEFRERCQSVLKGFKPNGRDATIWMVCNLLAYLLFLISLQITVMKIQDKKIIEKRIHWDHASLLSQLGLFNTETISALAQTFQLPVSNKDFVSEFWTMRGRVTFI